MKMLLLIPILLLSGCAVSSHQTTVAVHDRLPIIPVPERPKQDLMTPEELAAYRALPESLKTKLQNNDIMIKSFADQLGVAVTIYNSYAVDHNAASDSLIAQTLGAKK